MCGNMLAHYFKPTTDLFITNKKNRDDYNRDFVAQLFLS